MNWEMKLVESEQHRTAVSSTPPQSAIAVTKFVAAYLNVGVELAQMSTQSYYPLPGPCPQSDPYDQSVMNVFLVLVFGQFKLAESTRRCRCTFTRTTISFPAVYHVCCIFKIRASRHVFWPLKANEYKPKTLNHGTPGRHPAADGLC